VIYEPVVVHLLTGAKYDFKPRCIVKAEIVETSSGKKKTKSSLVVDNAEKPLNEAGQVVFNDLKFPTGTRLNIIRLKFNSAFGIPDSVGKVHTYHVESNLSNAIVVKTNENQWFEAEGLLMDSTVYNSQREVTWIKLSNWLQRRYLVATRQSLQTPARPLSVYDFTYLHKIKFDNKPIITQEEFSQYWLWFGPVLHKIRYQRHLNSLWTNGFICGFLTREEAEMVLHKEQAGTFVIRLSERHDQLVISYQSSTNNNSSSGNGFDTVKHYLVKADDTHGARKTLPDFLKSYMELTCVLQIVANSEQRTLRRCDKDTAFREFYSRESAKSESGYTDIIEV